MKPLDCLHCKESAIKPEHFLESLECAKALCDQKGTDRLDYAIALYFEDKTWKKKKEDALNLYGVKITDNMYTTNTDVDFSGEKYRNVVKNLKIEAQSANEAQLRFFYDGEAQSAEIAQKRSAKRTPLGGVRYCASIPCASKNASIWSLGYLLDHPLDQNIKWLLHGLCPVGDISMLAAKRASMKSFVAIYLGMAAAAGASTFLGAPERPIKVLYLDFENGETVMTRRVTGLIENFSAEERKLARVNFTTVIYPQFTIDDGERFFVELVLAAEAELVIVDTMRRLYGAGEENASETSNAMLKMLRTACDETGCGILLLHHERKSAGNDKNTNDDPMDEIRGSSDIVAAMSSVWNIRRKSGDDSFLLRQLKNRYAPERSPLRIHLEGTAPSAVKVVCDGEVDEAIATESLLAQDIWQHLVRERIREFRSFELKPYFVAHLQKSERAVDMAFQVLLAANKLRKKGRGQYAVIIPNEMQATFDEQPLNEDGTLNTEV